MYFYFSSYCLDGLTCWNIDLKAPTCYMCSFDQLILFVCNWALELDIFAQFAGNTHALIHSLSWLFGCIDTWMGLLDLSALSLPHAHSLGHQELLRHWAACELSKMWSSSTTWGHRSWLITDWLLIVLFVSDLYIGSSWYPSARHHQRPARKELLELCY
jgi:hypothetical protein